MNQKYPLFSIIIPSCNRHQQLGICLKAISKLDYPKDRFEIIVVDDGSKIPLDGSVYPFCSRLNVKLITQTNAGPAAARNTGAEQAKGEFLAFTDDDCLPAPTWLTALGAFFPQASNCIVGGQTINALPSNMYSTASQLLIEYLYTYFNVQPDQMSFVTSNNIAVAAEKFYKIGGFDTTFPHAGGEDRELCYRWLKKGNRLIYTPEAVIFHAHAMKFRSFWKQHFNYGRGAYRFRQKCFQQWQEGVRMEPLQFYLKLLLHPSLQSQKQHKWLMPVLMLLTQFANLAGYLQESSNRIV